MKLFVKLNIFSALYAFLLLIEIESMGNIYRISRVTNLPVNTTNILVLIFDLFVFIISTIIFFYITRKYLNTGKLRYLLSLLWIPYFAVFTFIFALLLPITDPGDDPAPVLGLLFIGIFIIYPCYIAFINLISSKTEENKISSIK